MRDSKTAARSSMVDMFACPSPPVFSTSQLDGLSVEVIIEIMLQLNISSLTRFRCHAMERWA